MRRWHEGQAFPEIPSQCRKVDVGMSLCYVLSTSHMTLGLSSNLSGPPFIHLLVGITAPMSLGLMRIGFDCACELALDIFKGSSGAVSEPSLVPGT